MERSSKRGKIPQSDWPSIMARYEAGETLSSIARTYDCSPPAISYVVSRSRARQPGHAQPPREAPRPPAVGEPQLIKSSAVASAGPSANGGGDHAAHREAAAPPPADVPPAPAAPPPPPSGGRRPPRRPMSRLRRRRHIPITAAIRVPLTATASSGRRGRRA